MTTGFLLTALVVVATPGTGVLYTLAAGLSRGARASVDAAAGCTLLPQFVTPQGASPSLQMLELSAAFMLVTFAAFALYGIFAAAVRNHVISKPQVMTWMRRSFGAAFVALAGRLAATDR
jgi:threonine/homoserine/homoserine lactone efflux protein